MPTLLYDPHGEQLSFLCRFSSGTIIPLVVASPLFWFLLIIHTVILLVQSGELYLGFDGLPELDWKAAQAMATVLTFFLVFYTGNCYTRFYEMHNHCIGIQAVMQEWAIAIQGHFHNTSPQVKWNLMRHMLGAAELHYSLIGGDTVGKTTDGVGVRELKGMSEREWESLRRVFTRAEIDQLKEFSGFLQLAPLGWALTDVKAAILERDAQPAEPTKRKQTPQTALPMTEAATVGYMTTTAQLRIYSTFEDLATRFRSHCGQTHGLLNQPIPFPYFHSLKVQMAFTLFVIGYSQVFLLQGNLILSLPIYALFCGMLIGLQQVAVAMADPFGDDSFDFDVKAYVESAHDTCTAYLRFVPPNRTDGHHALTSGALHNPLLKEVSAQEKSFVSSRVRKATESLAV